MANEFLTNEDVETIQKLIQEVVNDPTTYLGSKYLPSIQSPVRKIRTEVVEASGGLTNEHIIGTDPKYIQGVGMRVQSFEPPSYKESIHYDEKMILDLREIGQNDRSKRGIKQKIDFDSDKLNRRLEARIEYQRWQALLQGSFTWMGETFSYGIPTANRATPLGAVWSLDSISENNSANPLRDIRYWTSGGKEEFRKYKITEMVMNPNTARWILDNTNTKSFISSLGGNSAFSAGFKLQNVLDFCIPGAPKATVYDGWYQSETVVNSKVTVGNAIYMIPDGYILFVAQLPGGDVYGDFTQALHLASGDINNPGVGKFFVVDDNIGSGTKGGPKNPYMDLVAGVYGGVNLSRAFDVLTAKVIA